MFSTLLKIGLNFSFTCINYTPTNEVGGYTGVTLSVHPSVHPSIRLCVTKACQGHNFKSIKGSDFKLYTHISHTMEKCSAQER